MDEDIVLKIKEKEVLEVIKYISVIYALFLFVLGAILEYQETVIQVSFICVFAIIIDVLNNGEFVVSEKGVKCRNTGFIRYKEIYKLELNERTLIFYTRNSKKPYRINFSRNEDYFQIQKVYKFMDAKVKRIEEDIQDNKDFEEKISK